MPERAPAEVAVAVAVAVVTRAAEVGAEAVTPGMGAEVAVVNPVTATLGDDDTCGSSENDKGRKLLGLFTAVLMFSP